MNITIPKIPEKTIILPTRYEVLKGIALIALTRANMPGMYPLGIAFAVTLPPDKAYIGFIGLSLGLMTSGISAFKYLAALFIFFAAMYLKKKSSTYYSAAALGISLVVCSAVALFKTGISREAIVFPLLEASISAGMFLVFSALGEKSERGYLAAVVVAGGILNGIADVFLPINMGVAPVAAIFLIMSVCYALEAPVAVLTSAVIGLMTYMNQPDAVTMTGMFTIGAFFSALLSGNGKFGAAIGFLCGITISALYSESLNALKITEIFGAFVVFAAIPERVHLKISSAIVDFVTPEYEEDSAGKRVSSQLKTIAKAVSDLADGVTFLNGKKRESAMLKEMFDTISSRVCNGCSLEGTCRHKNFKKSYDNLYEIWQAMEEDGFCDYSNVPVGFKQVCIRAESFLREFNHVYELYKQNTLYQGEALSGRDIIARQYGEIANVINSISRDIENGENEQRQDKRRYRVLFTEIQEPKKGQAVCGDSLVHFERDNRFYAVLCDGMGSGETARKESRLTAKLFSEFLNAGFEKETAVSMINSALALKADKESFSTVDILEVNLETGAAEFLKIGSAQSFIKSKSNIEVISSKAVPMGILENIEAEVEKRELKNNDIVLMVSDGVSEAGNGVLKNEWIKKMLSFENRRDDEMCRLIISGAKARMNFSDDMTGVIVRIKRNRECAV